MKINLSKSKYMVFSRSKDNFATRLTLSKAKQSKAKQSKSVNHILGVWLTEDSGN